MTCWQIGGLVAVTLVLVALAVGVPCSPFHASTWWPELTGFVEAKLRAWQRWSGKT